MKDTCKHYYNITQAHTHKPHVIIAIGTQQNDDKTYTYEVIMIFKIYNKDFGAKFAYLT